MTAEGTPTVRPTVPSIEGVVPVVPTPFDGQGRLDLLSLRSVTDYLVSAGVHGLAVCGVASESYSLTDDERGQVIATVADEVAGRVPVLAGVNHHSGEGAASLCQRSEDAGADALFVMPPHFVKPSGEALVEYFEMSASAVEVPIMIQDNPNWTGVTLPAPLLVRLGRHERIRLVKVEVPHPPTKMRELRSAAGELALFGGLAGNWFLEELASGSVGTMPAAIMPQVYVQVWERWQRGDHADARVLFDRYHPAIRVTAQQSVGFAMVKWILWRLGVLANPRVRNPLAQLSAADQRDLEAVCGNLDLLKVMRPTTRQFAEGGVGDNATVQ